MNLSIVSWLAPIAALAMVACSGADLDQPNATGDQDQEQVHDQDRDRGEDQPQDQDDLSQEEQVDEAQVDTAWVPGTPEPADTHVEGVEHKLILDWVPVEDSIKALTDHSRLVVSGEVVSTRFDVMRAHSQAEDDDSYNDLPVTIASVKVDEVAVSTGSMLTPFGEAVAAGTTVDVMFAGGLLSDGCTLEADDNPLPTVGEETVLFLDPQASADAADQTQAALATDSHTGVYAVTGGPQGRVVVEDGIIQGSVALSGATAVDELSGQPIDELLAMVRAQAALGEYVPHEERDAAHSEPADHQRPNALGGCGITDWRVKWCRYPTNVTYSDHSGWRWPVGTALHRWMYTHRYNSLYLYRRVGGNSDVNVWESYYGYTGWYGYATYRNNRYSCITSSVISLNNTYYRGSHHAMSTTVHEVGHSIGFGHAPSCNSIMYYNPTVCNSSPTYCDARAAAWKYPY